MAIISMTNQFLHIMLKSGECKVQIVGVHCWMYSCLKQLHLIFRIQSATKPLFSHLICKTQSATICHWATILSSYFQNSIRHNLSLNRYFVILFSELNSPQSVTEPLLCQSPPCPRWTGQGLILAGGPSVWAEAGRAGFQETAAERGALFQTSIWSSFMQVFITAIMAGCCSRGKGQVCHNSRVGNCSQAVANDIFCLQQPNFVTLPLSLPISKSTFSQHC